MFISFPCSVSLSYWYNWGSFLGIALVLQVVSGLILLLNYNRLEAYDAIIFIIAEVNYGWLFKLFHSNNARVIFLALYIHLFKNMSIYRYRLHKVWYSGLVIIVLIIGAGFTGYVLVGRQIRYWAAIVITSLIRVLPVNGEILLYFVWGGYSINWTTLQLLFVVHFILPFVVLFVIILHLVFLHKTGRTRGIFSHSGIEKIPFYPYFIVKDMINIVWYSVFLVLILLYPYSLGEPELFEEANYLNSPMHITPEWYFLVQYAILRRVPSKGIGVVIIILSIIVLFLLPLSVSYVTPASNLRWGVIVGIFSLYLFLSYLGIRPISQPYITLAIIGVMAYFIFILTVMLINILASLFFS